MLDIRSKSISELSRIGPSVIRVLEGSRVAHGCCTSDSLEDACRDAGVDVEEIAALVQHAESVSHAAIDRDDEFDAMSLAALCDHIVRKHHAYTREADRDVATLIRSVCSVHGIEHPELSTIQRVFGSLALILENHLLKEERVLFPYIALMESSLNFGKPVPAAPFGSIAEPIRVMLSDHEAVNGSISEIRRLSGDLMVPEGACNGYRALYAAIDDLEKDLRQHIHLEDDLLFPKAMEMEMTGVPIDPNRVDENKPGLPIIQPRHH